MQTFAKMRHLAKRTPTPRTGRQRRVSYCMSQRLNRASCACGGTCPHCRGEAERGTIPQAKLTVNEPGDAYEQEADRVADQVMRMPDLDLSIPPAPQQVSPKCAACEKKEKAQKPQTKPAGSAGPAASEAPPIVHEVLRSPGQPLDTTSRAYFESRFGYDFSRVRLHSNSAAEQSARIINAKAYTVGNDIVFGAGQFELRTQEGQRLIAHELTHVVQQTYLHGSRIGQSNETFLIQHTRLPARVQRQIDSSDESSVGTYTPADPNFQPQTFPQPKGAGVAAQGRCALPTGILQFALVPRVGYVNARIEFVPNERVARLNPTISYIQTVRSSIFGSGTAEVDVLKGDKDPFYGAQWDETNQRWVGEPKSVQIGGLGEGSRPYGRSSGSAVLNDSPMLNIGEAKFFETVVVVVETGEVLGSLSWYIVRRDVDLMGILPAWLKKWLYGENTTTTIVGNVVCSPEASPQFHAAVKRYYREHPESRAPAPLVEDADDKGERHGRTYTVVRGDYLIKIANDLCGDPAKWKEIYAANPDIGPNPDLIFPGQVLIIPCAKALGSHFN